jgi:rhamnulokinase
MGGIERPFGHLADLTLLYSPMNRFLVFDIGASGGRALSGTLKGSVVSLKEVRRFYNGMTHIHGHFHWDIHRLLEEIKRSMKDAVRLNEIPQSIGIDTWGVDYGLLDETGQILDLPYAYRDPRTNNAMEEVFRIIPKTRLYELTGIQFLQFNTLFQLYAEIRDRLPMMQLARDLLFMPDLLNYYLSGSKFSEFTFATTSQLLNPETGQWAPEIFHGIQVPMEIMQTIVQPGTVLGELHQDISKETGFPIVQVTAVASHDTASAIAAIPAENDSFAYISSGTWSLMGVESKTPVISSKSLEFNLSNEGGVEGTYRVLKNIMGLWLLQECQRWWPEPDLPLASILSLALSARPFQILIDPDHPSLLNPLNMPEALLRLAESTGQPEMHTPGEFARCIFESLAFRYRQTLEELRQVADKKIERIHIIGGGSQNEVLCQFAASATGLPVIAGPAEGTALGNLMVQAMAQGNIRSLSEVRCIIRNSFEFRKFYPTDCSAWDRHYSRFLEISHHSSDLKA